MKNYGFIRIASACPLGRVGDVMYNTTEICNLIDQAVNQQAVSYTHLQRKFCIPYTLHQSLTILIRKIFRLFYKHPTKI